MKKLLLAIFALPVLAFGQGLETFDNATALPSGSSYGNGTFTGNNGITWTYVHCQDAATYPIDGNGILLRRSDEPSSLSATLPGGVGSITLDTRKGYTGAVQRRIELVVNGDVVSQFQHTYPSGESASVAVWTIDDINVEGNVDVQFRMYGSTGNQHIVLDNISWTGYEASTNCGITTADLSALLCNDNGTGNDPADDYITFDLNPAGDNLGTNGYTVSVSSGTITPATAVYGQSTSFQLNAGSAGAGDVVVTITDADSTSCSLDVTITDPGVCSSATPVITATPATLTGFDHVVGTPSVSQTFTVSGIALTDDITVTAPADFEVSLDNTAFTSSVVLSPVSGVVATTTVHVRGNAAAYGAFSGTIVASSTDANDAEIAVSGFADDYVYYTIDQINGLDTDGVADSLGVLVEITGVLHCMDFRSGSGYNMAIIDASGEGMYIFSTNDIGSYTDPVAGDSVKVKGVMDQYSGLVQVRAHTIELLESGAATNDPIVVTALGATTVNQYITLENVTLVTPIATFPTANTNLDVTDGTTTFQLRILASTDLGGTPAPQGPFNVTGIGTQFDSSLPYTSGYQLLPCGTDAIELVCAGANLPVVTTTTSGKTITASASGTVTYQWINCDDETAISGATTSSFTPETPGEYAVIVDNGTCSNTSACVLVNDLSVSDIELGKSIVAYPNPVNEQLTIKNYGNSEVTFTVTDLNGKVVVENTSLGTATVVNTVSWNKGVYFVHFNGVDNATHTMKVVK